MARETDSLTGVQQPPLPDDEKAQVKALITGLMLSTPPVVRSQISEALSIISSHDFPAAWPTLLPELVEKLRGGDPATNAAAVRDMLDGAAGPVRDVVVLNAAAALVVAGAAGDLTEGRIVAERSIDSGAAHDVLAAFVSASRSTEG